MIYLLEQPQSLKNEEELIRLFPAKRREKFSRITNQRAKSQGIWAYLLLCLGLRKEYGIQKFPEVEVRPMGKPYLKEKPEIYFNVSHSDEGILCAVSKDEVGADIQGRISWRESLVRRILAPAEREIVLQDPAKLTLVWTLKESYLKYQGTGIRSDLRILDLSEWAMGKRTEGDMRLWCTCEEEYAASVFSREPLSFCRVTEQEVMEGLSGR